MFAESELFRKRIACDVPHIVSWRAAAGIVPNKAVAAASGIEVKRGILVDDLMRTSAPEVYAVGECCEHRGVCYGLVAPL